ncbi:MAG: Asp-tRNA(Asn)/Glu-tRNA(Gln) amidotransferase subunit GatA [Clostridia bacterium]|nr:Asp-tRNA(Asn)/Glu-tRNA(Gln) amidotransferase subunit GatA [Clostridia bacterium]
MDNANERIARLSAALDRRELCARELVLDYLERIEQLDGNIGAFITVTAEKAIADAERIDAKRARGGAVSALAGIPFAVKDNICVEGVRTTCGSKMLKDYISPYTATAVQRLIDADAILLGKLNMDEFAMGSATDTSFFGVTRNTLDTDRVAGGSSGGSAAAVAADMAAFTLGSDTGGSVRQPAAFCGVVGLKSTYGAVSRYGLVSFASSLEQIGPISAVVGDNALVFGTICGYDKMDATTLRDFSFSFKGDASLRGIRIGVCNGAGNVNDDMSHAVDTAGEILRSFGAKAFDVRLPDTDAALAAYYIISASEASSNLGRYDGVRYGYRAKEAAGIDELFIRSRTEGFGDEVKRRIMLGVFCLNREGRDAYYKKALAAKRKISAQLDALFDSCDAVIAPIAPTTAFKLTNKKSRPVDIYRDDAFGVIANIAGIPSLCLPCGRDAEGMPVGVQIMGKKLSEPLLYSIGLALEQAIGGRS